MISPSPLQVAATGETGRFQTYLVVSSTHQITPSVGPLGFLKPMTVPSSTHALTGYMAPSDSIVVNGSFSETVPLQLPGWTVAGSLPVSRSTEIFFSQAAALVVGKCDPGCLAISGQIDFSDETRSITSDVDRQGVIHLVWRTYGDNAFYYRFRTPGGVWSATEYVVAGNIDRAPILKADANGGLHLFLREATENYLYRPPGGVWTLQPVMPNLINGLIRVEIDNMGGLYFMLHESYSQPTGIFYRSPDGSWSPLENVPDQLYDPIMAVDPLRSKVYLYAKDFGPKLYERHSDGRWTSEETFDDESYFGVDLYDIVTYPDGSIQTIWSSEGSYYMARRTVEGDWLYPLNLPLTGFLDAETDARGNLHILTTDQYYLLPDGNLWISISENFNPDHGNSGFMVNPETEAVTIFTAKNYAVNPILLYENRRAIQNDIGRVRQTVTIPPTMKNPTLSWVDYLRRYDNAGQSAARLHISNGSITTTVPLSSSAEGWSHHWLPMDSWAGEQITITFELAQAAGEPYAELYIDDVALGSGFPDIRLDLEGPTLAGMGQAVTLQLAYENPSTIVAAGATLVLDLPAGVTYQSGPVVPTISPTSLTWDLGTLTAGASGAIDVTLALDPARTGGQTVPLTANLTTTTPEANLYNNSRTLPLFVGQKSYLPLGRKP